MKQQETRTVTEKPVLSETISRSQIRVKGKNILVPSVAVGGTEVVVTGRPIRVAAIRDEDYLQGESVSEPDSFLRALRSTGLKADLLTFTQKFPDTAPKFVFPMEWDNVAAIATKNYDDWWNNILSTNARKTVRRSAKRGLNVEQVEPTDEFIQGVVSIYNETPIRQGRFFWHYGKGFDVIKAETLTYVDRSIFLGAFFENTLVGFIKLVCVDQIGRLMQIISMAQHVDKYPTNALIAKAVEVCAARGFTHLTYGRYTYGNVADSSLAEFKGRNGFEKILLPRYYVPLTLQGKVIMKLGLHKGIKSVVPPNLMRLLLQARARTSKLAAGLKKASQKQGEKRMQGGAIPVAETDMSEPREINLSE